MSNRMPRVIALVPAHDESARIEATIEGIRSIGTIGRIVVVDDGSSDGTAELARRAGAEVIVLPTNVGKGAALDAGLDAVRSDLDVLLLLDADLGASAAQAGVLLEPVLSGEADMSIARFPRPAGKAGFGLVMGLARRGIQTLGGAFDAQAPLSGQRAMTLAAVEACTPFEFGYGVEVALTVRALRAGLKVIEVPTTMSHAATGRDLAGFAHRGRQFLHVAIALVRLSLDRGPRPR